MSWWDQDFKESKKVNMKVEYESTPIRHLAVKCPDCNLWFFGYDIIKGECLFKHQLKGTECHCPKCGIEFKVDYESNIDESGDFPEFYDNCLRQKVILE